MLATGTDPVPESAAAAHPTGTGTVTPEELDAALREGRIEVHYQPVVLLPLRDVVGFEALARLRRPDGVLLPPDAFVPVAERTGLVVPLGEQVLRKAVAEAARWAAAGSPIPTATVSVNVAPAQLLRPGFVDDVTELLADHGVAASALVLEITESTVASPLVRPVLGRLAQVGVRSALDDFGVGFATLDNLRRLPVHLLKLDASFVGGVTQEGAERAIVRVVIDLAHRLGISVVAEGVETDEQARILERLGCPAAQGHLFAPAHPDPVVAAGQVPSAPTASAHLDDGGPLWSGAVDAAVLGAVRWLTDGDPDRHRAAVFTVATAIARLDALPATTARLVGRLALVHDLARLRLDGEVPAALRTEPLLAALMDGVDAAGEELAVVRRALAVVDEAMALDPALTEPGVAAALQRRLDPAAPPLGADDLPPIPPLNELLEDLDRRRLGRRGLAGRADALAGITRVLSSSSDPTELLTAGLEEVRRIVGAASASLERWERDSGVLRTLLNVGLLGPGEVPAPEDETYALSEYAQPRRTLLTGLPYLHTVDDADADAEAVELLSQLRKYSSAAVPLFLEGRLWGQLWVSTEVGDPPFRARDVELLVSVATLMSVVVAHAEYLERVARLAFEDPLTRVGNRRAIDDALDRLAGTGTGTTVALLDVDRLKEINDSLGHASGDRALVYVGEALRQLLPRLPGAVAGRLGGDEFCVLAPERSAEELRSWVSAVRQRLQQQWPGLDVSVGVARASASWSPREVLARADADLYRTKRRRRPATDDRDPDREPAGGAPSGEPGRGSS